jgi:beta-mannosidase
VPDAERWWPLGHGEHPLYDLDVMLEDGQVELDAWHGRIGFRTVRIDTEPDESGTPFTILVNDRPIYIKGANWIPDDAFVHRVDRARYEERILQAASANINLLRACFPGRTSCSPVRPTPKKSRCVPRWKPRRGTTSCG